MQPYSEQAMANFNDETLNALKAAAFDTLLLHLRARTDVQNIDMMGLTGFCRNCLSEWMENAAHQQDIAMNREQAREIIYGMPYADYKVKHQTAATPEQLALMEISLERNKTMRGF
jgi:uncharacterized protein